jgi:hypothetical protein
MLLLIPNMAMLVEVGDEEDTKLLLVFRKKGACCGTLIVLLVGGIKVETPAEESGDCDSMLAQITK